MATIIYEKTRGALIPSSERTVTPFESGLCRVDHVYTCATASAQKHRVSLAVGASMPDGDTTPAIDGLNIFPTPQEVRRQDGFTDFIVSGYGRTDTKVKNFEPLTRTIDFGAFFFSLYEVSGAVTVKRGEVMSYGTLGLDPIYSIPFGFIPKVIGDEIRSVQNSENGPFISNVVNWDGFVIPLITRQYAISTYFAITDNVRTTYINVTDPVMVVTNSRNYGVFSEIEFISSQTFTNSTPSSG